MNSYAILAYWETTFKDVFATDTTDDLKMKIIRKAPLQDDPTRQAPYIVLGFDQTRDAKGIIIPDEPIEIGGSAWWKIHLELRAAPKVQTTRDKAYYLVDLLTYRIVHTLRSYGMVAGDANGAIMLQNRDWNFITELSPKVYGGESEWLSYVDIRFFQRVRETGPYPYLPYPDELEMPST